MTLTNIKRTFVIGDEWIYFKLYCGPKTADKILTQAIKPVKDELLENGIIDKWFFIRYADPKLHLRVRFHFKNPENIYQIIKLINEHTKPFIENDLLWKVQIDTYQREIERYGTLSMELSEELFYYDSELITETVDMIEGDEGEIIRWQFSLRAINSMLDDFKYTHENKLNLLATLKDRFGKEFGMDKMLKLQLDKKFRHERQNMNHVLNRDMDDESEMKPLYELLLAKSEKSKSIANKIIALNESKKIHISLNNLVGSYIHMLMNRLFKSKQRLHELVIYDFLYRYYKSEWAKNKYNPKLDKLAQL